MQYDFVLALNTTAALHEDGDDVIIATRVGRAVRLRQPRPALRSLVAKLAAGGGTRDTLCEQASADNPGVDLARLYFAVDSLCAKGLLRYTLICKGQPLASLEPASAAFHLEDPALRDFVRLSRFACLRRVDAELAIECPLGHALVRIHDIRAAAGVASLVEAVTIPDLASKLDVEKRDAEAFACLLISARVAFGCDAEGGIAEDENPCLRQWEFHDLLFHNHSRMGRHGRSYGGTYRFAGNLPGLPAVKPPMPGRRTVLHVPDMAALERTDIPFSRVLEARRSVRIPAAVAILAAQLGEFLYRVARVKSIQAAIPESGLLYECSVRPCASGGAMHELELYLCVARCDGLGPGLYHYAPLDHELEHVADLGPAQQRLLANARASAGLEQPPDVLITLATRFQRVAWKYESMAYALTLKNAGALYQQMYLVATAMGLAPCGLGGGDADVFAEAAGLDYYAETSVGEFMLSAMA